MSIRHQGKLFTVTAYLSLLTVAWAGAPHADFALDVHIDPATHGLEVRADIELPETYAGRTLEFLLTDAVEIVAAEPAVRRLWVDSSLLPCNKASGCYWRGSRRQVAFQYPAVWQTRHPRASDYKFESRVAKQFATA